MPVITLCIDYQSLLWTPSKIFWGGGGTHNNRERDAEVVHQPPVAIQLLLVPEIRKLLLIMSGSADLFGGEIGLERFGRRHCRVSGSCSSGKRGRDGGATAYAGQQSQRNRRIRSLPRIQECQNNKGAERVTDGVTKARASETRNRTKEPPTISGPEPLYTYYPRTPTYLPYPAICTWVLIRMFRSVPRPAGALSLVVAVVRHATAISMTPGAKSYRRCCRGPQREDGTMAWDGLGCACRTSRVSPPRGKNERRRFWKFNNLPSAIIVRACSLRIVL